MTIRSRKSSKIELIGPELSELSALELENLPFLTLFTLSGFCPEIKSTGTNGPLSLKKVGHFRKCGAQYDANS